MDCLHTRNAKTLRKLVKAIASHQKIKKNPANPPEWLKI
jgi:hypothetical protein